MSYYTHKTAIVTGAASGIGAALSTRLCAAGASVVACDLDTEGLDRLAARLDTDRLRAVVLDVTDAPAMGRVMEETAARGGVDLVFNNAGIASGGEVLDLTESDWRRAIEVNLVGVINGVRAAYPIMARQGSGHIVNVASISGLVPFPFAIPYTVTKHGVVGLSLALRAEAAAHGVRVSVACPGTIQTPIWQRSPVRGIEDSPELRERLGRGMPPERCAELMLRGVRRNKAIITITLLAKLLWMLQRLSPALSVRFFQLAGSRMRALTTRKEVPALTTSA